MTIYYIKPIFGDAVLAWMEENIEEQKWDIRDGCAYDHGYRACFVLTVHDDRDAVLFQLTNSDCLM